MRNIFICSGVVFCASSRMIEAVIEGTSAHIRKRGNLDGAALLILGEVFRAEHVKQTVVQRAQIRVYLALQVAGQKAELLARLGPPDGSG